MFLFFPPFSLGGEGKRGGWQLWGKGQEPELTRCPSRVPSNLNDYDFIKGVSGDREQRVLLGQKVFLYTSALLPGHN